MGRIYLNNEDRLTLINIKEKLENKKEKQFIERLLEQEENNRRHFNQVASVYKKEKRKENKDFARSKSEIKRREDVCKKRDFSLK
jgi:hypothetical protein